MRRLNLRPLAKIRGKKRHLRSLRRWVARFESFFPTPASKGSDDVWYGRLPVHAGLVVGRRAERWFQRECIRAMLDVVALLQHQKPCEAGVYVVALVTPLNLFDATVDVVWGTDRLPNMTPALPPTRSLQREWHLPRRFPETGTYWEEEDDDGRLHRKELWAVGDMRP